jgi:uncharacterized protein (TIGR00730 family)
VFAGSSLGAEPRFAQAAVALGRELAGRGYGVVYGGSSTGLMGVLADAALAAGGTVTGIIPEFLVGKEVAHRGLTELKVVTSMHHRKEMMAQLADGFIALPGGFGTIEELFEVLTWSQLGLHAKPCGLLDVAGYFGDLLRFLDGAVAQQFLKPANRARVIVGDDPRSLLDRFEAHAPPGATRWVETDVT